MSSCSTSRVWHDASGCGVVDEGLCARVQSSVHHRHGPDVSLEKALKLRTQARLLIIDEIGYIPIARQGAILVFQLVSRRDVRGPLF